MKKTSKILAGILAAAMMMSPVSVWAGPSITDKVVVVGDSVGKYVVTDKIEEAEVFKTIETEDKEMTDFIKEVNEGKAGADAIKTFVEMLKEQLETITDETAKAAVEKAIKEIEDKKLDFLTGFMSVEAVEGATVEKNENGKYDIEIEVPIITEALKDINILYYNKTLACWEIIEPTEVNVEDQTIKMEIEDFSLIAVVANIEDAEK